MIFRMDKEWKRGCSMAQNSLVTLREARNMGMAVSNGTMVASMRVSLRKVFMRDKVHTTMHNSKKPMLDHSDEDGWMAMVLRHSKMADTLKGHSRMDESTEKD